MLSTQINKRHHQYIDEPWATAEAQRRIFIKVNRKSWTTFVNSRGDEDQCRNENSGIAQNKTGIRTNNETYHYYSSPCMVGNWNWFYVNHFFTGIPFPSLTRILIQLLRNKSDNDVSYDNSTEFPYKAHVIHIISCIAKGDGFEHCHNYFDIQVLLYF